VRRDALAIRHLRALLDVLRRPADHPDPRLGSTLARQRDAFRQAQTLVRCFYAVLLFFAATAIREHRRWAEVTTMAPLWPVRWIDAVGIHAGLSLILAVFLFGSFLAALVPHSRTARLLAFAGLLEEMAFRFSFGKIDHFYHAWIWAAFVLVFLPALPGAGERGPSLGLRQRYLATFVGAAALPMLFYSLSGFWKASLAPVQWWRGEVHSFAPDALAYHVAQKLGMGPAPDPIPVFFVDHPYAGWPLFVGHIYLEIFALVAAFRPALYRLWAGGLIAFHVGSGLILGVHFPESVLFLGLFYLASPFQPARLGWRRIAADLPIFGVGFRARAARAPVRRPEQPQLTAS
jgi:hypothetical protein